MRPRTLIVVSAITVVALVAVVAVFATRGPTGGSTHAASPTPSIDEGATATETEAPASDPDAVDPDSTDPDAASAGGESGDPDGGEGTVERLQALAEAKADGTFGVAGTIPRTATPGWAGERVVSRHYDDWEPAIAADPNAPFVYRLVTRYGGPRACPSDCPDPAIILQVSKDGGRSWGPFRFICTCKGTPGMYDPEIEVADDTGVVEAAFMRGYSVWFTSSADHGKTWRKPVPVYGRVAWQDKPVIASSADGLDVYVAFNGPSGGDAFVAFSHDGGRTWKQRRATDSPRYFYAFGGQVLSDGTVVFSESDVKYSGEGRGLKGASRQVVLRSTNGGHSWTKVIVDSLQLGKSCKTHGCPPDYYDGHVALGMDGSDRLVLLADGALKARGIRRVWAWTSTDGGAHWTSRVRLSTGDANAGFPAAVGRGSAFRVWYMSRQTGRWNTFYRTSTDGITWTTAVKISDATGGAHYITPTGFREAYGDYGEIDVTNLGKTVAVWGEGASYPGPGGVWFNRGT